MTQQPLLNAAEIKRILRTEALTNRFVASYDNGDVAQSFLKGGLEFISKPASRIVAAYYPIRDEIDVLPLLAELHNRGAKICLPITKPGPALVFKAWTPGEPLNAARFGLFEPPESNETVLPHIVLVPLLAFDRRGNRLGFGAGYYDSALRALRQQTEIVAVGVGFDQQEIPDIPHEPHDELLDFVLTPSGLIRCGD